MLSLDLSETELEAIYRLLCRLERRWVLPIPDATVYHAYDPLPLAFFLPAVRRAAELTAGRRFLDIGCGIGSKLVLMHTLGWQVAGIDRHAPYILAAKELVPEANLTIADAFQVESFDADLVYMYRPMVSDEEETLLEKHVLDRVKAGTVCFFPFRHVPEVWVA